MKRVAPWILFAVGILFFSACERGNIFGRMAVGRKTVKAIVIGKEASPQEKLAAREIRRYVYLRTARLVPIKKMDTLPKKTDGCIVVAGKQSSLAQSVASKGGFRANLDSLKAQEYLLKTLRGSRLALVCGGDEAGTLYGAYRVAEQFGVRFYLHGDVLPDTLVAPTMPVLDERGRPLFELRGIQPFHDFPEGPDWWNGDDYKAIIAQLPKLRMNFFGLHCYPEARPHAEPTVWIGRPEDMNPDGTVRNSYPTAYFNSTREEWSGNWGYTSMKTGKFLCGSDQLFDADLYGSDLMRGLMPAPTSPEGSNELFNRTGKMMNESFTLARALGVRTCIGTEIPLTVPAKVNERLSEMKEYFGPLGGRIAANKENGIEGTEDDLIYQTVRYDLKGYVLPVPDGRYRVTLKFCELYHNNSNGRVFDVSIQDRKVLDALDIFVKSGGRNRPWDATFEAVEVKGGKLRIGFTPRTEFPAIAGIEVSGANNFSLKINCGGEIYKDYLSDLGNELFGEQNVRQLYLGLFERIKATHPLDYYWFWTTEGWTWQGAGTGEVQAAVKDLKIAVEAAQATKVPFKLATCGWVLGPAGDRGMFDRELPRDVALSCINRQLGMSPVDGTFARIQNRPLWAIPWMEDDPTLTSVQLWVGRMRRDAADALAYGCTGLMGIHWRTRIMGPNVAALAAAGWDQRSFSPYPQPFEGPLGGKVLVFPDQRIGNTANPEIYRTAQAGMTGYRLRMPNGTYAVTLKFAELELETRSERIFSVRVQDRLAVDSVDLATVAGPASAWDCMTRDVKVANGILSIDFYPVKGEPIISGIEISGPGCSRKINCGGAASGEYEADLKPVSRHLPNGDFYADWALYQFGPEAGGRAAAIFARIDCSLPLTSLWTNGPGALTQDYRPWEQVQKDYAFVGELEALRPSVRGAGNLERLDYWLANFRAMRAEHHLRCVMFHFNQAMERAKAEQDATARQKIARELALPLRIQIARLFEESMAELMATVSTPGELGTIANLNQHSAPDVIVKPGEELAKALGGELPAEAQISRQYTGPTRVIVPTVRGSLTPGTALDLKVIVLAKEQPAQAAVYWRPMGEGDFVRIDLTHQARGVYRAQIQAGAIAGRDIEYYVEVKAGNETVNFPASAPHTCQTVVAAEAMGPKS